MSPLRRAVAACRVVGPTGLGAQVRCDDANVFVLAPANPCATLDLDFYARARQQFALCGAGVEINVAHADPSGEWIEMIVNGDACVAAEWGMRPEIAEGCSVHVREAVDDADPIAYVVRFDCAERKP